MNRKGFAALLIAVTITILVTRAGTQQHLVGFQTTAPLSLTPLSLTPLPLPEQLSESAQHKLALPANEPKVAGAELIHDIGQPLLQSSDATQRQALTKAMREAATNKAAGSPNVREPQALDILTAAYLREQSSAVKIEIISSLSEFSIPEAAELINRALEDGDPAVRKAAQQAKIRRDRRMIFSRCCE